MAVEQHTGPPPPQIPAPPSGRHLTARDALICIGLCTLLLLAFEGASIRRSGEEMQAGWERSRARDRFGGRMLSDFCAASRR